MAESLGHFVDAVTAVEQAGRQQVPDLVRPDRADPRHCEPAMSAVAESATASVVIRATVPTPVGHGPTITVRTYVSRACRDHP